MATALSNIPSFIAAAMSSAQLATAATNAAEFFSMLESVDWTMATAVEVGETLEETASITCVDGRVLNGGPDERPDGGAPECVAAQFEACGDNEECSGALICGGSMDRSACSDDENHDIEAHIAAMCGGGGDQEPCSEEWMACMLDGACAAVMPAEGTNDVSQCLANDLCAAGLQCHTANNQEPCSEEWMACMLDSVCAAVMPAEGQDDVSQCLANDLCAAGLQCHTANNQEPCSEEGTACELDSVCAAVIPAEGATDISPCLANDLCAAALRCMMSQPGCSPVMVGDVAPAGRGTFIGDDGETLETVGGEVAPIGGVLCQASDEESNQEPCSAEGTACMLDSACAAVMPAGETADIASCSANDLCAAMLQCGAAHNQEPCSTESMACAMDATCAAVMPADETADMAACLANALCVPMLQCYTSGADDGGDAVSGGGGAGGGGGGGGGGDAVLLGRRRLQREAGQNTSTRPDTPAPSPPSDSSWCVSICPPLAAIPREQFKFIDR